MDGGTVNTLNGGWSYNGIAYNNSVLFDGGTVKSSVFGGQSDTGVAMDNIVTLEGGTVYADVRGGYSASGDAIGNTVEFNDGEAGRVFGGMTSDSGKAENNKVYISGGGVSLDVYGGYSASGDAVANTVAIDGNGEVGQVVYGGRSEYSGNSVRNKIIFSSGEVDAPLYGGHSAGGDAANNTVIMNGRSEAGLDVYGGYSSGGNAVYNNVDISDGDIERFVYGGYSENGYAAYNSVDISDGDIGSSANGSANGGVYGGYSVSSDAVDNTVTVSGGEIDIYVYGGHSDAGNAIRNRVEIKGGMVEGHVYGGHSSSGDAAENKAVVNGADLEMSAFGGFTEKGKAIGNSAELISGTVSSLIGGQSREGMAMGNTAAVTGGLVNWSVYGGFANDGNAEGNIAEIKGGVVSFDVFGGFSNNGDVTLNKAIVSGGGVSHDIYGGAAGNAVLLSDGSVNSIIGGQSAGDATLNKVIIDGGKVASGITGGLSTGGDAAGNEITINNGDVGGNVYGGYSSTSNAINNVVNINDAPILTNAYIYGGYSLADGGDGFTGNTFNLKNSETIYAAGIANFQEYNFWLPENTVDLDKMFVVTSPVDINTDSVANVFLNGNSVMYNGDRVALITGLAGVNGDTSNPNSVATLGSTVVYDFKIYTDNDTLWAELADGGLRRESGSLPDSRLPSLALLSQGADLVSMLEYFEVSRDKTEYRRTTFGAVTGGSSIYDTGRGSDVDIDSFALMAGVIWDVPVRKNSLLLRAFIEAGWGDYDMDNNYGGARVRGGGDTDYYGAGLHARYSWLKDTPGGFYTDASLRIGSIDSDFKTSDMTDNLGRSARYEASSTYYGAHVGVGHVWKLNGKTSLDLSSKYLWTHIEGDDFTMSTGDRVELYSADSRRWRTGFRVTQERTEQLSVFVGAYYEYEFDGDANGRAYGIYDFDKASLSGGTGIGELGVILKPANNDRFSAVIGVQGYVGTREGFTGRLKLQYNF